MRLRQLVGLTGAFVDHLAPQGVFLKIRNELVSRNKDREMESHSEYTALESSCDETVYSFMNDDMLDRSDSDLSVPFW